jgi:Leucine-rich repeat (LRR) protein
VSLTQLTVKSVVSPNASLAFAPFSTLPNLQFLDMANLPDDVSWIWQLTTLKYLSLFDALYVLKLDPAMGNLVNLESLNLWVHVPTEFPSSMASWTRLKSLTLIQSSATGLFPTFLSNFTALESISITGYIIPPGVFPDLATFPNLTGLSLSAIGAMTTPPSLVGANNLIRFGLDSCPSLTRYPTIPTTGLPNLRTVFLSRLPSVYEPLPIGFYNSPAIESFSMDNVPNNEQMPPFMSRWTNLRSLIIKNVPLTGTVPTGITGPRNLSTLSLTGMAITGPLVALGMPSLQTLTIGGTQISDLLLNISSTPSLAQLYALLLLCSPSGIKCPELSFRSIVGNIFSSFPSWISQAISLKTLEFSLNGILPQPFPDISSLINLEKLNVAGERFVGELPNVFDSLPNLHLLSLKGTSLNGTIPQSALSGPETVDLSLNKFVAFPTVLPKNCTVQAFFAANNSLAGPTLATLGSCQRSTYMDLSNNLLGPIVPATILGLPRLLNLVAGNNQFSAVQFSTQQPLSQASLNADLSGNRFSGPIDDALLKSIIQYGGSWYAILSCGEKER